MKKQTLVILLILTLSVLGTTPIGAKKQDFQFHAKGGQGKPNTKNPPEILPWHVDRIDAEQSWTTSTGSGINVAMLDSGIDSDHPDLEQNIVFALNFAPNRNGRVSPNKYEDTYGHGTWTAGILGAVDNEIGTIGVAPSVNIYALKIGTTYPDIIAIINAIDWCISNDIDIISMSFGSMGNYQPLEEACQRAYNAGILLVCSSGNYGVIEYPAKYDSVIAVGGTDENDLVPSWAGQGLELEIVAPCTNIYGTDYRGRYGSWSGTSGSSPQVAGVLALLMSANPDWTQEHLRNYVCSSAEDLGPIGWDTEYGYGVVEGQLIA